MTSGTVARSDVVALYIDRRGPYPSLVVECFDEARDAKTYEGPWPVVAHPPCGPWGSLRGLCTRQDKSAGPHGVEMVRTYGGVLEHPAHSRLFRACGMPFPWELPDQWGGRTYDLNQVSWGHKCAKATWLYVVGVPPEVVSAGLRTGGTPTHVVTSSRRQNRDTKLPELTVKWERAITPREFAMWLVDLASKAKP